MVFLPFFVFPPYEVTEVRSPTRSSLASHIDTYSSVCGTPGRPGGGIAGFTVGTVGGGSIVCVDVFVAKDPSRISRFVAVTEHTSVMKMMQFIIVKLFLGELLCEGTSLPQFFCDVTMISCCLPTCLRWPTVAVASHSRGPPSKYEQEHHEVPTTPEPHDIREAP